MMHFAISAAAFVVIVLFLVVLFLINWDVSISLYVLLRRHYNNFLEFMYYSRIAPSDIGRFLGDVPLYYINLDRHEHRRAYMESEFVKHKIKNYHRIEGVDGQKLSSPIAGKIGKCKYEIKSDFHSYTIGELACTLSHLKAIKTAYDNGNQYAVICEDDLAFHAYHYTLKEIIAKAPSDFSILKFTSTNPVCNTLFFQGQFANNNTFHCFSAALYLINRKGMKEILDRFYDAETKKFVFISSTNDEKLYADWILFDSVGKTYQYFSTTFAHNYRLESTFSHSFGL